MKEALEKPMEDKKPWALERDALAELQIDEGAMDMPFNEVPRTTRGIEMALEEAVNFHKAKIETFEEYLEKERNNPLGITGVLGFLGTKLADVVEEGKGLANALSKWTFGWYYRCDSDGVPYFKEYDENSYNYCKQRYRKLMGKIKLMTEDLEYWKEAIGGGDSEVPYLETQIKWEMEKLRKAEQEAFNYDTKLMPDKEPEYEWTEADCACADMSQSIDCMSKEELIRFLDDPQAMTNFNAKEKAGLWNYMATIRLKEILEGEKNILDYKIRCKRERGARAENWLSKAARPENVFSGMVSETAIDSNLDMLLKNKTSLGNVLDEHKMVTNWIDELDDKLLDVKARRRAKDAAIRAEVQAEADETEDDYYELPRYGYTEDELINIIDKKRRMGL